MDDFYYPEFDERTLVQILSVVDQIKRTEAYFGPECPYSESVKSVLRGFAAVPSVKTTTETKWMNLEDETMELYRQISDLSETFDGEDATARFQALKTKAQMLKNVIEMNERARGLAHMSKFQQDIIDIMEQVLDSDQRVSVIEKLKARINMND